MAGILAYNNSWLAYNSKLVECDPYNPLNLPPFTARLLYLEGREPERRKGTFTQVSESPNLWDFTYEDPDWSGAFYWNDIVKVLGANTSLVEDMSGLFYLNGRLEDVCLFDTRNVTNMSGMFKVSGITTIPKFDTSNVTDMSEMFDDCHDLTSIPQLNTSLVTDMTGFCRNCESLVDVPFMDTSNVVYFNDAFRNCENLRQIPLFDISKVEHFDYAFEQCYMLQALPLFDTRSITTCNWSFADCYNVASGSLALYNQLTTNGITPARHYKTFSNCGRDSVTGAAELAQIHSSWK